MGSLEAVLNHPAVWRGSDCARVAPGVSTGFAELDAHLPGGGWPTGAIRAHSPPRQTAGWLRTASSAAFALIVFCRCE